MKIIKYKISRYGSKPMHGALINEGEQWLCTKDNVVDYVLDGIMFTNKKYIRNIHDAESTEQGRMMSQIIQLKYTQFHGDKEFLSGVNLDEYHEFFCNIMALGKLIEIGMAKNDSIYVGTICEVNDKSFIADLIDTEANHDDMMRIPFDRVRYIKLNTDYLCSLELFIENKV